jgi:prepilin-type N-terminal cleavage/methylation domain-containing protein
MHQFARNCGFTLIELSVVLVIIGLITGGILLGRDLIKAAEIRAQVTQLEKFTTSVTIFRLKYNAMPGDMHYSRSAQFGFYSIGMLFGMEGMQDGNGLIQAEGNTPEANGEPYILWRHLSDAQLIEGSYGTAAGGAALDSDASPPVALAGKDISRVFPTAKIGNQFVVVNAPDRLRNYYYIVGISNIDSGGFSTPALAMTPYEAYAIDQKRDDGMPLSGSVVAAHDTSSYGTLSTAGDGCTTVGGQSYQVTTGVNALACQLRVIAGF